MTVVLSAALMSAPAAQQPSGLAFAVTIACAVTALVAVGMVVAQLRRTSRLTPVIGGLGAASAAGILALSMLVGSAIVNTDVPSAVADVPTAPVVEPVETGPSDLSGLQLETLPLD
jgi:ribose/xylose/arabinose/galactoside ABC-type transport system permease subunit